jgi:hypothetical protein
MTANFAIQADLPSEEIVHIVDDFVTLPEQMELQAWAGEMLPFLTSNTIGQERLSRDVRELPCVPASYTAARLRLQSWLGLSDGQREPRNGWYLGSIGEGGFVHRPRDTAPQEFKLLRCNLFVQAPACGGEPVVNDVAYPVRERMVLCFFPNEQWHHSVPVEGPIRRIVCSFGYVVAPEYRLPPRQAR